MNKALVWYNLSYYTKTLKFIAPCMVFIVWHFSIFSQSPIPIWSQYYLTAITIFILSNWIGTGFINCEHKTQQYITRLHVGSDLVYHVSKIIAILLFLIPFYALMVFYPIVFGFFVRHLLATEVLAVLIIHFLFSLMGVSVSVFFNADFHDKTTILPLQVLVVFFVVVPFAVIFEDNTFVRYAVYLLPPLNFLGERLHALDSGVFLLDSKFLIFILYSLGYSLGLIAVYVLLVRKKFKV